GPDGDAFLEDFGPLVDQRIHAALDDFLVGNLPPFDALLLRRLQDDVPNDRVRQGVAAFIFVEARAGFLPETAHLAEPVGDGRVALVLRPQMSLALADAPADVQAGEVAHAEGAHSQAEFLQRAVDLLGARAFLEQETRFPQIAVQHAVADEAVAVAGQYRHLLQRLAQRHDGGNGFGRGLSPAHVFQQPHDIGRA